MTNPSASRPKSPSRQLTVNQPTRGADRNQGDLVEGVDQDGENFLLPSLDDGITLLDIDGGRGVSVLQSLVLDHLLLSDGPAFWVDAHGYATTTSLARLTPSQRLLDRIHVARGFTAYQHYGALCDLPTAVNQQVRDTMTADAVSTHQDRTDHAGSSPLTPSLIVVPALDAQYRDEDTLNGATAQTLQARALARLTTYAQGYDSPVLVTRTTADEFTAPIETAVDHHLRCEQTRMGPRFIGDEFETLVYPVDGGAYYQTTFAYWRHLLGARAKQVGLQPDSQPRPAAAGSDVGSGVLTDGTTATLAVNPLLDAWTGSRRGED